MTTRYRISSTAEPIVLDSEFASARVTVDLRANGPRLKIHDVRHGTEILLDPMDLVALANADPDSLSFLHVPSAIYGRQEPDRAQGGVSAEI